jgi:hypothetical protein
MHLSHSRITIAITVVALLAAVAFGLSRRARSQQLQPSTSIVIDDRFQQIEKLADQPLRVVENDDSPFRILDAKVKEISGPDFTKLTGKHTALAAVCSVPQVRLLNSSAKEITGFVLAVRDPATKTTRGMVQSKVSIKQGEIYTVPRQAFIEPEWTSAVDNNGKIRSGSVQPDIHSDKYWISFASRADLFVTVARVSFQDGSIWTVKEGGDIK